MPKQINKKAVSGYSVPNVPKKVENGRNFLLSIGIDKYLHCPPLYNAVNDAQTITQLLQARYNFLPAYTKALYNEEATKRNIYQIFRSLVEEIHPIDNLIIYYSGHGEYDKVFELGYWVPVDAKRNAFDEYLANSEIRKILGVIRSRHTFLMVDSCFSGSLFAKGTSRNVALRKERDPSRWGLTAGRNEIVTDGKPGDRSPFANSVIYQLTNAEKSLGVATLCDKVLEVVSANASQTPRGEPLKVEGHQGGQFVFHLKNNELADWETAVKAHAISSYQKYLNKYPTAKHTKEAEGFIYSLKATQVWEELQHLSDKTNTEIRRKLFRIHNFLTEYADSILATEAEDLGEYLQYKVEFLKVFNNLFALRKFVRRETPFQKEAKQRIQELIKTLDEEEQHREEEKNRLEEEKRLKKEKQEEVFWLNQRNRNTIKAYEEYLANYPSGKWVQEAKNQIDAIRRGLALEQQKKKKNLGF